MKYIIDIDGTICHDSHGDYVHAVPFAKRIQHFNKLYDQGNEIHYWTARGSRSGKDWSELTRKQLEIWGVKYHSLQLGKPVYDIWIDDKAQNVENYFELLDSGSERVEP